ncbi:MAG TPA: toll/interleukin-1 receptor domain-containing protein [Vicinamibacterales bacterium]|nr:toll/interleukin-1 receptor domain-containing protein [Vicinamibacterales bacterium]
MTVFVSYKSEDRAAVQDIVTGLRHENIDVWWDQGIAPTTDWRAEVARQLRSARVVVAVWSRNSVELEGGRWVIQEAEDADARGILVPVIIDDVLPPLGMRHRQAADLVDWRGDRQDPRWRGFVETVRAKVEGRAIDTGVARSTGGETVGTMLRGRSPQLFLALGLAALVVTSAISFGPFVAASLVGALALSYVVLNLLFSRRRHDRAAATFLRRAFAIGWVTTLTSIVVWVAAIGAGAYPHARRALYDDFSIAVYDELRKPVPEAQVTVALGERHVRVPLGADGIGRVEYPLFWGPREAAVSIRHTSDDLERPFSRDSGRFADLILGIPSGVERFRVHHLTLEGLAIDALHHGQTPPELVDVVPRIVGVIRNPVWDETEAYLRVYPTLGTRDGTYLAPLLERPNASSEGGSAAETLRSRRAAWERASAGDRATMNSPEVQRLARSLRWPRELYASIRWDFSKGVLGCPTHKPLDADYRLILGDLANYRVGAPLEPNDAATAAWRPTGLRRLRDEDGSMRGALVRLVDHQWLGQLIATKPIVEELHPDTLAYLSFMTERSVPPGVVKAEIRLAPDEGCDLKYSGVELTMPPAELRVSIIENVSVTPLPITAVVQGMARRDRIEPWVQGGVDADVNTPWPGGMLAPGTAIAVPRRLIIQHAVAEKEVTAWRAGAEGPLLSYRVAAPAPGVYFGVETVREASIERASGIALRAGQVRPGEPWDHNDPPHASPPYVIGPSVERLAVRVNDIEFPMREDAGMAFAMIGGQLFGSCPFVYATADSGGVFLNRGQIIADHIGANAEGTDRLYLGRSVGRIEIRELEPEISQLNRVRLLVQGGDGRERVYPAAQQELRRTDTRYVALRRGETLVLEFPGYSPQEQDRAVFLEAVGFYTPTPMPHRDGNALRRNRFQR